MTGRLLVRKTVFPLFGHFPSFKLGPAVFERGIFIVMGRLLGGKGLMRNGHIGNLFVK
jgi:hypothetical protein